MRVLYLNPFSQQVSGPDESLLTLLSALVPLGVEPHVVLPQPGPPVERYQCAGAAVHYAPLTVLKRRMRLADVLFLAPRLMHGAARVARIIRRESIDVVHTNMEVVLDGAIACSLLRVPHILHYRGNTLDRPKRVFDVLTMFWTGTAERVLCISQSTAEIFQRRGLGAKVTAVYNGVELERFAKVRRSPDVRHSLGASDTDVLIGTIGRIHPRKDVATFLRAGALVSREIPSLRLVIVGCAEAAEERAYEAELMRLATSLGIAGIVRFAGARRDIPEVLHALDLMMTCSRDEGFGRVVAEAMAAGTPIVATAEGAYPELLRNGSGLLASAQDEQEFANAAKKLLLHSDERDRVLKRATARASAFDARHVAQTVYDLYERALARRSP